MRNLGLLGCVAAISMGSIAAVVGCTYNFERYREMADDGSSDASEEATLNDGGGTFAPDGWPSATPNYDVWQPSDAGDSSSADAPEFDACASTSQCILTATSCSSSCNSVYANCTTKCLNSSCKNSCKSVKKTCATQCSDACVACTPAIGCFQSADCSLAVSNAP